MRFKKLRLAVGISLIVFMIAVGNIILIGEKTKIKHLLEDNEDDDKGFEDTNLVDPKALEPETPQTPIETTTNTNTQTQQPTPVEQTPPPVVHQTISTRAS